MVKLTTPVDCPQADFKITYSSRVIVLGSCFADVVGRRLAIHGFDVCVNPFGALYNPGSIASALTRLNGGEHFVMEDCVEMGAGAGQVCSYYHHTSFARPEAEEFLLNANDSLDRARSFWKECDTVLITFGTACVWELVGNGMIVSNCLKRPSSEFRHRMMSCREIQETISSMGLGDRRVVFSISPIRHLSDGAHSNSLSKASLLLALQDYIETRDGREQMVYFPAYEIVLDELRDYRFYAEDMVHPSAVTENIVWERFVSSFIQASEYPRMKEEEKLYRQSLHRKMLV